MSLLRMLSIGALAGILFLASGNGRTLADEVDAELQPSAPAAVEIAKFLPAAEKGHAIGQGGYVFAYPVAVAGFLILMVVAIACLWFGLVFLIIATVLGSIGSLIYALSQGMITTWEQLFVGMLYLAVANAVLILPARALLPEKNGATK
jgi:hypothetical protein